MDNFLDQDYYDIKAEILKKVKGLNSGNLFWKEVNGRIDHSREPGGYYVTILKIGEKELVFRYPYHTIESEELPV